MFSTTQLFDQTGAKRTNNKLMAKVLNRLSLLSTLTIINEGKGHSII